MHPFLQYGATGARLRSKYGIEHKSKTGLVVIFGHHAALHTKGIRMPLSGLHRP